MAVNRFASVYEIIEKVYRDTGSPDDINFTDLIVWAGEALDKIGAYAQYKRKVTGDLANPNLDITNYKAKLPCDFYRLEQIAVNGKAATWAGNTFHHLLGGECCSGAIKDVGYDDLFKDNFGNIFSNLGNSHNTRNIQYYTFDINDDYLTLNVKEGKVCIAYIATPVDDEGYPMIPDEESYKEAISRYLIMKLDYISYRRGKASRELYNDSQREWAWYCNQAGSGAMMGEMVDKQELFRKRWTKLIPEIRQHVVFHKP